MINIGGNDMNAGVFFSIVTYIMLLLVFWISEKSLIDQVQCGCIHFKKYKFSLILLSAVLGIIFYLKGDIDIIYRINLTLILIFAIHYIHCTSDIENYIERKAVEGESVKEIHGNYYKKDKLLNTLGFLIMSIVYVYGYRFDSVFLLLCYVFFINMRQIYVRRKDGFQTSVIFFAGALYIRSDLYLSNFELEPSLLIYFFVFLLYDIYRAEGEDKLKQALSIGLILPVALFMGAYLRDNRIIRDAGLERAVRNVFIEKGIFVEEIERAPFSQVKVLVVEPKYMVREIDGIEKLENLEEIHILGPRLKSIRSLSELESLKRIVISSENQIFVNDIVHMFPEAEVVVQGL